MIAAASQASSSGASSHVIEIVLAGLLFLGGLRSLVKWFGTYFDARSGSEHVLFALFASARVGTWFALGGLFLGYGVLSEPQGLRWFALVPLALAGLQLLTGIALGRQSSPVPRKAGGAPPGVNGQPEAAEVESARILANEARGELRAAGLAALQILRLADEYIALDRGEGVLEFIRWAKSRTGRAGTKGAGRRSTG